MRGGASEKLTHQTLDSSPLPPQKKDSDGGLPEEPMTQKKYKTRLSPPLPANRCCTLRRRGNDGEWWMSHRNVLGICQWRRPASSSGSPQRKPGKKTKKQAAAKKQSPSKKRKPKH